MRSVRVGQPALVHDQIEIGLTLRRFAEFRNQFFRSNRSMSVPMISLFGHLLRNPCEFGVIARVTIGMTPEDQVAFDQEQPRHRPGVADDFADGVSLQRGPSSGDPYPRAKHLPCAPLPDSEGVVKPLGGIGHGARLGPIPAKECSTFSHSALVEEENRWIGGIGSADLA